MRNAKVILGLFAAAGTGLLFWKILSKDSIPVDPTRLFSQNPVKATIYYESLCGDSIRFFHDQLWPAWGKIPNIMELEFIPYGKASYRREGGEWSFECQHGPEECLGNMVQACALKKYPAVSTIFPFLYCVMTARNPASAGEMCANSLNLDWSSINSCVKGSEGGDLLHQMGVKTESLTPKLTFVPSITINGVKNEKVQQQALSDFLGLVCNSYQGSKPDVCP